MARATKTAAKVAGKVRGAAKALEGYPKIFHHLAAEHTELGTLMKRVCGTDDQSSTREELFWEIRANLLAHSHGEEREFYPVLRQFSELKTVVSQCLEDHKRIAAYLEELESQDIATSAWLTLFERMKDAVTQHVEREENELFPKASELLTGEQSDQVYDSYERVEEHEKAALSPEA